MPGPFAIQADWAGGVEQRLVGQDTSGLFSSVRNVRTGGSRKHCLMGGADRPGQLPTVQQDFITNTGILAWVLTLHFGGATMQIGACEGASSRVIAEGKEIDTQSVRVHGSKLSWRDGQGEHSVHLGTS